MSEGAARSEYQDCLDYIEAYWDRITVENRVDTKTLIGLPFRYVTPNRDMFQECYYWDAYFIALAFKGTEREDLILNLTDNFIALLKRFGRIPNSTRFYHLSRSQPPFLSSLIWESYEILSSRQVPVAELWLKSAYKVVMAEYWEVWRGKAFPDEREVCRGLSRYYDLNIWHNAAEAESGWDMTCRFDDHCLDFVAVDLNCLLYKYERDLCRMAERLGEEKDVQLWENESNLRRESVDALLWNPERGAFFDYDFIKGEQGRWLSAATFAALWSGLATAEQAAVIVDSALPVLEQKYGLVTTEFWVPATEADNRQWAWPHGWAPLHYMTVMGLDAYGYHEEARRIATKWVELISKIFKETGFMFEKYDVVQGTRAHSERYRDQVGFGWTNSVFKCFVNYLAKR